MTKKIDCIIFYYTILYNTEKKYSDFYRGDNSLRKRPYILSPLDNILIIIFHVIICEYCSNDNMYTFPGGTMYSVTM